MLKQDLPAYFNIPAPSSITLEQWNTWTRDPVTQEFFTRLAHMRSETLEAWASGAFTGPMADNTIQLNARALARVQTLTDILEISYE